MRPCPGRRASLAAAYLLPILALVLAAAPAAAAPGDTTWVHTFDQEFFNWATPHYGTYTFPDTPTLWEKVVLFLTIGCPGPPADCDPWDRLGHLRVVTPDQGDLEIARFVTPYDITITNGPGECTWNHDVTNYKSLLREETELRLFVESWIGDDRGWLLTLDFAFIEGTLPLEPYRVVNLWQDDWVEYGNPDDPVTDWITPLQVAIPAQAQAVEVNVFATGHGQGNTNNCAEFCQRQHTLVANGNAQSHTPWRNCLFNSCSPQGGTWNLARAGWCPGSRSLPWTVDITGDVTPGTTATLDYQVEAYENFCRPGNPDCVSGVTCADCNYNNTGHTPPIFVIQSQAIFFAPPASLVGVDWNAPEGAGRLALGKASPNPFRPSTSFDYTIPRPADVSIEIHDVHGRVVRDLGRHHATPGTFSVTWDGRDATGAPVAAGVYFYSVRADGETASRKMIRLR